MPQLNLTELAAYVQTGIISFPTDTVAAVAARPQQGQLLYDLKQRSPEKPLILMAATAADLWPYTNGQPQEQACWTEVITTYWPGPLTLVLPASNKLPAAMNPMQTGTIGIRVPNHPVARAILAATGPLATTSANRSGEPALTAPNEIEAAFPQVGLLQETVLTELMAGYTAQASGVASTVVQWTGTDWQTLRQGTIHL